MVESSRPVLWILVMPARSLNLTDAKHLLTLLLETPETPLPPFICQRLNKEVNQIVDCGVSNRCVDMHRSERERSHRIRKKKLG